MKTTLRTFKTLNFDLVADYDVYLEITVSSTGKWNTYVIIPGKPQFEYVNRIRIGSYEELKNQRIEINHEFSFAGIPKPNIDDALKQTKIKYSLVSILGPLQPFKNKTSKDLDGHYTISEVKLITIK
jgi:hypothetical protein